MDNTEYTDDTLEDRAVKAARLFADGATPLMSINDWEALNDYSLTMLMELDPLSFTPEDFRSDEPPF